MAASSPVLKFVGNQSDSIVTDVAYDHHGRRLASVTADGAIRIYDLDDNGVWCMEEGCEIKLAHLGTLWKVDWAHPGFGRQLLATCSQDRTVKIWEEHSEAAPGHDRGGGRGRSSRGELSARGGVSLPRWVSVATLNDSDYGVLDVKFAPRHLGLRIASASEDGLVRVYKAADAPSGGGWKLETSSPSSSSSLSSSSPFMPCPEGLGVSSISWCRSPFLKPLMAVGTTSGLVQIWLSEGSTDNLGKWSKVLDLPGHETRGVSSVRWSPQFCTSFDHIATCGGDGRLLVHRLERRGLAEEAWTAIRATPLKDEKGETEGVAWSVGWDVNGSSLLSSDGNACRTWVPDGEVSVDGVGWFCADSFQEAGPGTGVGDRKRMMAMMNRQDDGMMAPASAAAALASSSSTGAPLLHPQATVPEFFEG